MRCVYFFLPGKQFNFKKYDNKYINSLGEPYDYGSIMHYGKKYFTKDRSLNTIEPLQEGVSRTVCAHEKF